MRYFLYSVLLFTVTGCTTLPGITGSGVSAPSTNPVRNSVNDEQKEFAALMEKDRIDKKKVTAEVLTYLLNDSDPTESHTAAVIENLSGCDMILRFVGIGSDQIYHLPIARLSKNQFIIKKGNYTLRSKVCGADYYSQKNIQDPLILNLSVN